MSCHPDCQFVHPSDPAWDRARSSGSRGRGAHPYTPRGRSQSSFGPPGSGANSHPLGSNQGSSSWDDYVSASSSNPATTSGGWGTSSRRDSQAKVETSEWGNNATGDGWGNNSTGDGWGNNTTGDGWGIVKNDVGAPERQSAEPAASDVKSPASQWGGHTGDWGAPGEGWGTSDGIGWGSTNTGFGSGWGQNSTSNQWGTTHSETATSNMGSSMVVDVGPTRIEDGGDAAKMADLMSPVVPPDSVSSHHDQKLANRPVRVSSTPSTSDRLPMERKVSSPTLLRQSPVINSPNKSQVRTRSKGNSGQETLESLSTDSEMRQVTIPRDLQAFT